MGLGSIGKAQPIFGLVALLILYALSNVVRIPERTEKEVQKPQNVLLIVADDMRAEATPFLDPKERPWLYRNITTPNLERLAQRSMVFKRAYAQVARCNPSRSSFLTGRRPDTTQVHLNTVHFRTTTKAHLITLPEFFKLNGYTTAGVGKTFHITSRISHDNAYSWSVPSHTPSPSYNKRNAYSWYAVPEAEHTQPLLDEKVKEEALTYLDKFAAEYKRSGKPFFLMAGFKKPHLPFTLPEEFLEKYSFDDIFPAEHDSCSKDYPDVAWIEKLELYGYGDSVHLCDGVWSKDCKMPKKRARELRRAYYGCITYIDALIGEIWHKMDELQLWDDTVVVFMSDHGWHLGENGWWGKNTNLEVALHVPLMMSIPGLTSNHMETHELVELVDLYPTLLEATGHSVPHVCPRKASGRVPLCREGSSLLPLITGGQVKWKDSVFSQSIRPLYGKSKYSGYSVRTKGFRYTEWVDFTNEVPDKWSEPVGVELYDLEKDPDQLENKSDDPDYQPTRKELSLLLHQGWTAAQPQE